MKHSKNIQHEGSISISDDKIEEYRPWFIWIISFIQICVFIGKIINNCILTHRLIEINPLFGPSLFVLINMFLLVYIPIIIIILVQIIKNVLLMVLLINGIVLY
jgi:hypothetical protein